MSDIHEILSDLGIRLKSIAPGRNEKIICPKCGGGKTRETCLSVTIDDFGEGVMWKCHRATCGWQGGKSATFGGPAAPARYVPPTPPPVHDMKDQTKPDSLYKFFETRGIGAETVDAFGCYITRHWFPGDEGEQNALVFPYLFAGKVVNRKYRSPKKFFIQEKNPLQTMFNIDSVTTPDVVVWVEGEADCMAVHESGYPQVVTLPNGAPAELKPEDDPSREGDKRFSPITTHADLLGKVKKFILAGDMDAPGSNLREELARRLGRHRCWMVTWPEGCKDACDTLKAHGKAGVQAAIEAAKAYPISGIQNIEDDTLLQLLDMTPPGVMSTGTAATDDAFQLPTEGRLIVVTGYPGSGKTSWTRFVMIHTARQHARKWAVFSPEMQPWADFVAECAEVLVGKSFRPKVGADQMTRREAAHASQWLKHCMTMIVSDAEDDPPTLNWVLEKAQITVLRDGVTDLVIDPWNEIQHDRDGMTETDYTGRALQRLKAFGLRYGCNVWLIVHPAKPPLIKSGEKRLPPGPYDIAGSAHYFNKADLGITIHAVGIRGTEVHLWKSRHRRWGKRNACALLQFDYVNGRYSTPSADLNIPEVDSMEYEH